MATLNFEVKEPQPVQYNAKNYTIDSVLTKNETADDSNDYYQVDVRVQNIQLPDINISNCDIDSTNSLVTANAGNGTFSSVRVGDTITDSAGSIPSGTTVSSINSDDSEITLSQAPTSDESGISVTVTPQQLDATLAQLRIDMDNVDNTDMELTSTLYGFDGTLNKENRNSSGTDDLTNSDSVSESVASNVVNLIDFVDNVKNS